MKKKANFFQQMREEIKKVSWTSREELKNCGKIVIGSIFILGVGIYMIDLCIRLTLDGIKTCMRLMGA